ncbi:MAG: hypothetical protein MI974_12720 [Chitinophagales bacterium]|nr:hypothetical protein [Chitinophagales bacterium]
MAITMIQRKLELQKSLTKAEAIELEQFCDQLLEYYVTVRTVSEESRRNI